MRLLNKPAVRMLLWVAPFFLLLMCVPFFTNPNDLPDWLKKALVFYFLGALGFVAIIALVVGWRRTRWSAQERSSVPHWARAQVKILAAVYFVASLNGIRLMIQHRLPLIPGVLGVLGFAYIIFALWKTVLRRVDNSDSSRHS
jgi:hypothetical protein